MMQPFTPSQTPDEYRCFVLDWPETVDQYITGYALEPPSEPNLFTVASVASGMQSIRGDVRDLAALRRALQEADPEIVFHLAAQSLVRASYRDPVETFATNVLGTWSSVMGGGNRILGNTRRPAHRGDPAV